MMKPPQLTSARMRPFNAPPKSVLFVNAILRIESQEPMPNAWIRFWQRVLLGWRWEAL
jgi:hypothetical protein